MDNNRDFLLSNLINELVKDEWTAVNAYESAIATLIDTGNLDVIAILEDIRDEEYVHIGQLESCLSLLKGDPTEHIDDGSEEGFEQLELPEDDEEEIDVEEEQRKSDEETKMFGLGEYSEDDEIVESAPLIEHRKETISKEQMKEIICDMITKYDASEEEIFDELQSQDPTVSRDTARRLYKMCNQRNEKLEKVAEKPTFDDLWEELEEIGE